MVYLEPEVVNPPKEQSVPQFNKKEIIEVVREAQKAGLLPSGGASLYKHTLALKNMSDEDVEIVVISTQSESYGSNASLENIVLNLFKDFYFGAKVKQEYISEYILYYDTILSLWTDPDLGDTYLCAVVGADSTYSILCPATQTATDVVTEL